MFKDGNKSNAEIRSMAEGINSAVSSGHQEQ
jgi:hypothetical protein